MRTATRGAVAATALLLTGAGAAVPIPTADAAFPGHRGRIAYGLVTRHAGAPDTSDIWTSKPDGTNRTRLTSSGTASAPVWNRTGRRIAYVDAGAIVMMAADGSQKQRLVTTGYNTSPTWAPDGRRLAFTSDRGQGQQVYVYNLRTSAVRQLTVPGKTRARAAEPAWSPAGGSIAFVRDTGGQSDLYTVRTDGSALHRVTDTSTVSEQGPDWSPDGAKLAYYRYTGFGDGCFGDGVFRIRVADGRQHKVVDTRCSDIDPRWSPDGRRILWQVLDGPAGGRSADAGLFTVGLRGLHKRTVLSGANRWFEPDWQPLR